MYEDAPSQDLRKEPSAKLKKQRKEDEAADEAERWKEYEEEDKAPEPDSSRSIADHEQVHPNIDN